MKHANYGLSALDRAPILQALTEQEFDLLIIGGGITGAGVARDAASRGLSVALIEARDFAQGTSSRSSKLVHGGLRYLENLEFHLVFEALNERNLLAKLAPHLVHPLRFVIPMYSGDRVSPLKMGMGMWLYDVLSLFQPQMHDELSNEEVLTALPLLRQQGLSGGFEYSDAYMDDDRLVLETLRSAVGHGALAVNWVQAEKAVFDGSGKVCGVLARDQKDAARAPLAIQAKHVVSTVGPWTDDLGSKFFSKWKKMLRPSKGVHLTFERSRVRVERAIVMAADKEKRIIFGIPRHEMFIIGTTDTDYAGDPNDVVATKADVDYLLNIADHYFPGAQLTAGDVVSTYAGVRPLVADDSATESATSREHLIEIDPRNVTFVAGGKYTTYRAMSEEVVDRVVDLMPLAVQARLTRTRTADESLNPRITAESYLQAAERVSEVESRFAVSSEVAKLALERHGPEAIDLFELQIDGGGSDVGRLMTAEAVWAIRETMCHHLVDYYTRRFPLILSRRDHGLSWLDHIGHTFQSIYGWSSEELDAEKQAVLAAIAASTASLR